MSYQLLYAPLLMTVVSSFALTAYATDNQPLTDQAVLEIVQEPEPMQIERQNGIAFITGGVSDEEQAVIENWGKGFNLRVLMALKEGAYLSDVDVRISDAQGYTVLQTVAQGPFLYAELPPGSYTVIASARGETKEQRLRVGQEQTQVDLRW